MSRLGGGLHSWGTAGLGAGLGGGLHSRGPPGLAPGGVELPSNLLKSSGCLGLSGLNLTNIGGGGGGLCGPPSGASSAEGRGSLRGLVRGAGGGG